MTNESRPQEKLTVHNIEFSHDDIYGVVKRFYTRVRHDPILQVPFKSVMDWDEHIERLTHFWWVRFGGKPYQFGYYNPVAKHFFAGFNRELLTRWLSIFHETLRQNLASEQAELWVAISSRMGEGLFMKNELFKSEYELRQKSIATDWGLLS